MTLRNVNGQIRDFINDSTIKKTSIFSKKDEGYWDQLFVALDTIDDTALAIGSFQQESVEAFAGHSYLIAYGLLQALYAQQDAVSFLKVSLFDNSRRIDWKNPKYDALNKIRHVRNETIGHPTKSSTKGKESQFIANEISYCTIDRSSLTKSGFQYLLWQHSKMTRGSVDFMQAIETQDKALSEEMNSILTELKTEERKHKAKFKGKKLFSILDGTSLYTLSLIYGVTWNDHLAWHSFDYYQKQYLVVKQGLDDRYGTLDDSLNVPGTKEVVKKLDYVFSKIETYKTNRFTNDYEFDVHVDALIAGIGELKDHLKEIDLQFEI